MRHPLSVSTWGEEEKAAIQSVVDSGQFTMGPRTQAFEEAYAEYCGTKYCVAVNSGSSANLLMVAAFTLRMERDLRRVIVPAVGWATSYAPFQQYGWHLTFVDIDRDTLNYDLDALASACAVLDPDAILAINLLGNPNDYDRFPKGIPILEDNCESMGCEYGGKRGGAFGVMGTHSTFFSHHMCTMEGGLVTTDDEWYYHALLALRSHGWTRHLPKQNVFHVKPASFEFILPGYNVRPTEMQCAIGIEQLKKLPSFVKQRRENASRVPFKTQTEIGKSSWFGFLVSGEDRGRVKNYESRPVVTGNFLRQPTIRYFEHDVWGGLPNADYIHDHALMIGNNHQRIEWTLSESSPAMTADSL